MLDGPAGGFDVILSSGVVHHLVDPLAGLQRLREHLAPHGVLSLMVYGRHGRESLYRVVQGLSAEEENADLKRQMMELIFKANLELREKQALAT